MLILPAEKISALRKIISTCTNAAVVVHSNPDGDALGSGTALINYLHHKGKQATLVCPPNLPFTLSFITEGEDLIAAENNLALAEQTILECDTLFVLDLNAFHRTGPLETALRQSKARVKVLIDHHLNPDLAAFDLAFSKMDISSASELLFWVLLSLEGSVDLLPPKTRNSLMLGMTTDTNNFANSVYSSTFEMASMLLAAGVDRDSLIDKLYHNYRKNRLGFFADMLAHKIEFLPGGVALMVADSAFQNAHPLMQGESEGLVNIPLELEEVNMSLFLKQDEGHFRVSIRSKKGWSANALAKEFFNGGGHELAAGGKVFFPQNIVSAQDIYAYVRSSVAQFLQNKCEQ